MKKVEEIQNLEKLIGYTFKNKEILKLAMTHSSCYKLDENGRELNNERLEFLGDAVLKLVVSEYLFEEFPDCDEGTLTKMTANLVSGKTLSQEGEEMGLLPHIKLGKGLKNSIKRSYVRVLSGAVEALIGAIYEDGSFEDAQKFILNMIKYRCGSLSSDDIIDGKSRFQELVQGASTEKIHYEVVEVTGPQHEPEFKVALFVGDKFFSEGSGKNKRQAEQEAALKGIEKLEKNAKTDEMR